MSGPSLFFCRPVCDAGILRHWACDRPLFIPCGSFLSLFLQGRMDKARGFLGSHAQDIHEAGTGEAEDAWMGRITKIVAGFLELQIDPGA